MGCRSGQVPGRAGSQFRNTRYRRYTCCPERHRIFGLSAGLDESPRRRKRCSISQLGAGLQSELKKQITFFYVSDPSRYANLTSAAPPIVYSCLPVRSSTKLDPRSTQQIEALVRSDATRGALERYMNKIA